MDLCLQLHKEVIEQAHKHRVPAGLVTQVFFEAYKKHRDLHGSFRGHQHYTQKMHERYEFMAQEASKYIQEYHRR